MADADALLVIVVVVLDKCSTFMSQVHMYQLLPSSNAIRPHAAVYVI